jgi:hypothetical protein
MELSITASSLNNEEMLQALFGEDRVRFFLNKSLAALSMTCKYVREPSSFELASRKLMQHVVFGEQFQANIMIKANPRLLLKKNQARDYSGRMIIGTPFQAALGAEDERMWNMMVFYFKKLEMRGVIK